MHSDESSDDERGRDGGNSNSETDYDHKSSNEGGSADKIDEIDLKTLKLSQKYKSKMNREVCLFDKFSYCKNGVKCLRIHLKEVCWNRECDYRKCNQTHTGKMPISAFFEHWENLPYNSQLLHNLANLDNMDVQICLFICLI